MTVDLDADAAFDEPWQVRVFALARVVLETAELSAEEFRQRLIAAIAAEPDRPYWEAWLAALEALLADRGLVSPQEAG